MSVHVWWACACVTCSFWFKRSPPLEPDAWPSVITLHLFSLISNSLPLHSFLSPVSPSSWVSLSLSGAPSACHVEESWGAAQYSNVASFNCVKLVLLNSNDFTLLKVNEKPHETIETHPWFSPSMMKARSLWHKEVFLNTRHKDVFYVISLFLYFKIFFLYHHRPKHTQ